MNLVLRIRFATHPGQSLWVIDPSRRLPTPAPMHFLDENTWQTSLTLDAETASQTLSYHYQLVHPDGSQTWDWGRDRQICPAHFDAENLILLDSWNEPGNVKNVFYTEVFRHAEGSDPGLRVKPPRENTHTFRVKAPLLQSGQVPCLLGEGPVLGDWNTVCPILLFQQPNDDYFSASLNLQRQSFPFEYKYGIYDRIKKRFIGFEEGPNRLMPEQCQAQTHCVIQDGFMRVPHPHWKGAGVAIPVFSLRSDSGFGVGEFNDLKRLAEWGRKTGLKMIQILPINDTTATHTWKDSYPYAAISAFALHPLYLNLAAVTHEKNRHYLEELEPERQRLNSLTEVDYETVMRAKWSFLRQIFPSQKGITFRSKKFLAFFNENRHWLVPYAAFCCFRDQFGTPDYNHWPQNRSWDEKHVTELAASSEEMALHYFIQFHLHLQLSEAADFIHAAGLVLKGDIAIGVYRHGADAWQCPGIFHMNGQAGAPPDPFAAKGQNWGFPTYNWARMEADDFAWWKQRFTQMSHYFDAFRIDHILGFFRIWTIPTHAVEGILGHFVPAIPILPDEFTANGIPYDHHRYTLPFITDSVLEEIFGGDAAHVREHFLDSKGHGQYVLKPGFDTQRKVEEHFAKKQTGPRQDRIKIGLFDLLSNVILLESEGQLHFRFDMEQTQSFKQLAPTIRTGLQKLYVDYFFRRQDGFWKKEALRKLPALKRVTNMLICGEDLGLVPGCVPDVMRDLGLLSLEIQRMPKAFGSDFSRPANAPYLSVVTPSTHDMSTIRGWWKEDPALTTKFYHQELTRTGEPPKEATPEIVAEVIRQHLESPAMWSVFQMQDWLGMDARMRRPDESAERINIPANPNHYWRYRMHISMEDLLKDGDFIGRVSSLIREAGR